MQFVAQLCAYPQRPSCALTKVKTIDQTMEMDCGNMHYFRVFQTNNEHFIDQTSTKKTVFVRETSWLVSSLL